MRHVAAALLAGLVVAACTTDDADDEAEGPEPLRILVTNDDGVDNDGENGGVDALVEALADLPDTELVVVTPAEDRSATGSQTSEGPVEVEESATESGHPATVVDGFPADAVTWALDGGIDFTPDVVISGINPGQNIGPIMPVSGTVGAARVAAAAGVPALALSVGVSAAFDYSVAIGLALDWVDDHRDALVAGDMAPEVFSINVPSCPVVKELVEVPVDVETPLGIVEDCDSTFTGPTTDVEGYVNGYAVISPIPPLEG